MRVSSFGFKGLGLGEIGATRSLDFWPLSEPSKASKSLNITNPVSQVIANTVGTLGIDRPRDNDQIYMWDKANRGW